MWWLLKMWSILLISFFIFVNAEIRSSLVVNKLVRPVGGTISKTFVPLTELPPPRIHHHKSGRRHLPEEFNEGPKWKEVHEGGKIEILGDYYEDRVAKTVATVIFPDHIDHKHFQVTTQMPYFTVGAIDAMGYHPSTIKSDHLSDCEKIYQDHIADQYSDETKDYSEESLEMARMPLFQQPFRESVENRFAEMYDDMR